MHNEQCAVPASTDNRLCEPKKQPVIKVYQDLSSMHVLMHEESRRVCFMCVCVCMCACVYVCHTAHLSSKKMTSLGSHPISSNAN